MELIVYKCKSWIEEVIQRSVDRKAVTEQILFHKSVDLIGYPRQAYRGFLSLLNPLTPVPPVTARDEPRPFFHF